MDYNPQFVREAQILLWVQWLFFNMLGWAFGLLITLGADTADFTKIYAIISACLGAGQWIVLRHHLWLPKPASLPLWIGSTVVGFVIGQLAAERWARLIDPSILNNIGAGVVFAGILGVTLGLSLGIFQFWLLPRYAAPRLYWVLLSTVGWGLGMQLGSLFLSANFRYTSLMATLLSAAVSGLWMMQLLNPANRDD